MNSAIHTLFVAWQGVASDVFYPVGRVSKIEDSAGERLYEWVYIRGATEALEAGFRPFLSFPDLHAVYRSRELFGMFGNRLLSSKRPEFPAYLDQLNLRREVADAFAILARSGGRRQTDALELFSPPLADAYGGYRTWFCTRGIRNVLPRPDERVATLIPGEPLTLRFLEGRVPAANALELRTADNVCVGFAPAYLFDDTRSLAEFCDESAVFVEKVNPAPAPLDVRLLLRLETSWPEGLVPFATPRYEPLSEDAAVMAPPIAHANP